MIGVVVIPFCQAFVRGSLVEVDCDIVCFSPKNRWCLGVSHLKSCVLGDSLDHAFGIIIPMVSVGRTMFVSYSMSSEHLSEGLVVVFSASIVAPKLCRFVSHGVNSGLK